MRYYTNYQLDPNADDWSRFIDGSRAKAIQDFIEDAARGYGWSDLKSVWIGEGSDLTWYKHQEDMIELSVAFPNVLFTLWGSGQESDDLWKEYYFGGKCQAVKGEIIYPTFDESQLKCLNKECPSCYGEGVLHADGYGSIGCPRCNGEGEIDDTEMS